jgi:ankyrin repeat protein
VRTIDEALMRAAVDADYEKMQELINQGADIDCWRGCILTWAVMNNRTETVNQVLAMGGTISIEDNAPLRIAALNNRAPLVSQLLRHGATPFGANDEALHYAGKYGYTEVIKLIAPYYSTEELRDAAHHYGFPDEVHLTLTAMGLLNEQGVGRQKTASL